MENLKHQNSNMDYNTPKIDRDLLRSGAQVVMDDGDENILAQQDIQSTNFPLEEITLFACWNCQFWIIMLTSEY